MKSIKLRLFKLSFVIIVVSGLLTCANVKKQDLNTITMWVSYNNDELSVFKEIVNDFKKEYKDKYGKDINIIIQRVPFDGLLPKLKTSCLTTTTPDICRVDCAHVVSLAYGKAVWQLDTLDNFKKEYKDINSIRNEYIKAAIDSNIILTKSNKTGKWFEHLYGLPDQTNGVVLFYNKTLFRQARKRLEAGGLEPNRAPKTWEEFLKYAKALTIPSKKQYGFAMNNSLWWTFPFLNTFGAKFIEVGEDGKMHCVLNSKEAREAIQFKANLFLKKYKIDGVMTSVEPGAFQSGAISPDQGFLNQNYAMVFNGPWRLRTYRNAPINFGVALIPHKKKGKTSTNVGGTDLVIFKSCPKPKAEIAYLLLKYITGEKAQLKWCSRLEQIPVNLKTYEKLDVSKMPELKIFMEQMKYAIARPRIPDYERLEMDIINPNMELVLKGNLSVEQMLISVSEKIKKDILSVINQ